MGQLRWESASRTETGNVRKINEDALLNMNDKCLWAVADGMGGHQAGDLASHLVVEALANVPTGNGNMSDIVNQVEDTLESVNSQLCDLSTRQFNSRTVGTTVMCLLGYQHAVAYMWAGDSRLYRCRKGKLTQLNEDHSEVQRLINEGFIRPEQAENHPSSNVITRAVGAAQRLFLEVGVDTIEPNDIYLLCTDGLYREVRESEINHVLNTEDVTRACDRLVELALTRTAADNLSVVIAQARM